MEQVTVKLAGYGAPNWGPQSVGEHSAEVYLETLANDLSQLQKCITLRRRALRLRSTGNIPMALTVEYSCQIVYEALPVWAKDILDK